MKKDFRAVVYDQSGDRCDFAYRGIGVSNEKTGIYVINHTMPSVQGKTITADETDAETDKLEAARVKTLADITAIKENATATLPEDYASQIIKLMDTYEMMLDANSDIIRKAKANILASLHPADTAIRLIARDYAKQFRDKESPVFEAKADDMIELGNMFIRNYLGIPHPSLKDAPEGAVIVVDSLSPAEAIYLYSKKPKGLVLHEGSPSGHVGDFCKGLHLPCAYVSDKATFERIKAASSLALDGMRGRIVINPTHEQCEYYTKLQRQAAGRAEKLATIRDQESVTADGKAIKLGGTIAVISDVTALRDNNIHSITLYRTEAALASGHIPEEKEQVEIYRKVLGHAQGMPVRFRTFDFEGDKCRGLHLTPEKKIGIVKIQMRAILQAAGSVKDSQPEIMIPNIRLIDEVINYRKLLEDTYAELKIEIGEENQRILQAKGLTSIDQMKSTERKKLRAVPEKLPAFGIMIETPSASNNIKRMSKYIDFACIGTNDLPAKYMGCVRDDPAYQQFLDPLNDEIMHFFARTIERLVTNNVPYSLCGASAADETLIPMFLGMGATGFSAPTGSVLEMRNAVINTKIEDAKELYQQLLALKTVEARRTCLLKFNDERGIGLFSSLEGNPAPSTAPTSEIREP